jgi:O-acetyl-ADP-ribose deacetylase (regulator of RNase III)
MGKGIALEFKQRYPEMFKEYRQLCLQGDLVVGKLHVYRAPNKIIVNFPTKKDWRQPARLEYIEAGLQKFTEGYNLYGISSVSFPQLGCGSGGLDWELQVKPIMERYLKDVSISVYIHIF